MSPETPDGGEAQAKGRTYSLFERQHLPASGEGLRYRLYRLIFHHEQPDERNFDLVLIVAILASVAVVLATMPACTVFDCAAITPVLITPASVAAKAI